MFTRQELASKSLEELQQLGKNLSIEPIGNPAYPSSWIFPLIAAAQKGALDNLGQPTPAQRTLIKAALQNIWINRIDYRAVQQRLFEIWQIRMMLLEALTRLK